MWRSGTTYWPSPLVLMVRCCPVSVLMREMEAFTTAAADGSVTVPTMVASCAAPRDTATPRKMRRTAKNLRLRLPRVEAVLPAYAGESVFIAILQASFEGRTHFTNAHGEQLVSPFRQRCQEEKHNLNRIYIDLVY